MTRAAEPHVDPALAREHGLTDAEWQKLLEILGRTPTYSELGIFSVMWAEHCSYKSSKLHLKKLPTQAEHVLQGPGENAGAVAIGDGLAAIFKIESHNHPSFIAPVQGAATGVGGIIRDIFTMGARPVASLDSIHFGSLDDPKHRYLLRGVVEGIGSYGNAVGVATVGGETHFHACYGGNILVNAFNLGIVEADSIFLGQAAGVGNPVMYVGSKTGRDGIHGASLLASAEFDAESEAKMPTVQVGDPFTEKCLIEACLELMSTDAIIGIQDMGAAGLTCSSFEMADRAGTGIEMDLDRVPQRAENMTPYEMLLSESQERMLLVARVGQEERVREIFARWDLDAAVVGRVTGDGQMRIRWHGETVVDIPVAPISSAAPELDRPVCEPTEQRELQKLDLASIPPEEQPQEALEALLDSPNLGSKAWVFRQYDQLVQGNTVVGPGAGAAVIRVKRDNGEATQKGLALDAECNSRWCRLDPRLGTIAAVAGAARAVACTGARPLALSNCLNFGNPEKPEIMWQLREAIEGLGEAALALGTPVISGNVSLYNETSGAAIYPTPTIVVVGLLERWERHAGARFVGEGRSIVLLGETREELGGSEWLALRRGIERGAPPVVDLSFELRLQGLLAAGVEGGFIESATNVSSGGLALALARACFRCEGAQCVGAEVELPGGPRPEAVLFGESTGRVLVGTTDAAALLAAAFAADLPAREIGQTGGTRLRLAAAEGAPWIDAEIETLHALWARAIPRRLEAP